MSGKEDIAEPGLQMKKVIDLFYGQAKTPAITVPKDTSSRRRLYESTDSVYDGPETVLRLIYATMPVKLSTRVQAPPRLVELLQALAVPKNNNDTTPLEFF